VSNYNSDDNKDHTAKKITQRTTGNQLSVNGYPFMAANSDDNKDHTGDTANNRESGISVYGRLYSCAPAVVPA
jgi:hypothetical protein